ENLLITDEAGPIALAGVMGGLDTEGTAGTKKVLLEAANFDFVSIRRTARAFGLPSEGGPPFAPGTPPRTGRPAPGRAAEPLRLHAGGTVCKGLVDCYPVPPPPQVVTLKMAEVNRFLGREFPKAEAVRILKALEFKVEEAADTLRATVPPHRTDIQE